MQVLVLWAGMQSRGKAGGSCIRFVVIHCDLQQPVQDLCAEQLAANLRVACPAVSSLAQMFLPAALCMVCSTRTCSVHLSMTTPLTWSSVARFALTWLKAAVKNPSPAIPLCVPCTALQVLSHIPSPYQAHYEVRRILKPGGSHVFTVPFSPVSGFQAAE